MVWPVWIALACIVVAASWRRGPLPALAILAGLICTRIAGYAVPAPYYYYYMAGAALWVGIGGVIVSQFQAPTCGLLVIASGLCYPLARVLDAPVEVGSPIFVASDIFGALALGAAALGGGNGRRVVDYRGRFLGGLGRGRRDSDLAGARVTETEGGG